MTVIGMTLAVGQYRRANNDQEHEGSLRSVLLFVEPLGRLTAPSTGTTGMRIGFIVNRDVPNINYRATGPAYALKRAGHDVEIAFVSPDGSLDVERLRRCDAVHIYRLTAQQVVACIDDLRRRSIAITWDNDDDVRLVPAVARRYTRYTDLQAERDFRAQMKVFRRVDLVTTTTDMLAARWQANGAAAAVSIPNYPQPEQYVSPRRRAGQIVIGWVAALEHYADAEQLAISESLARVMERHTQVHVVTIGVRLSLNSSRYKHHRAVPFPELMTHLREFDLGIAPIADIPLNHARSDVKVKEYAAAGVPWLASARGPYAGLGQAEGGILVEDDGWEAAIEGFLGSRLRRFRIRRKVVAWGKSQCIDRHVNEWVTAFEQAIETATKRRSAAAARPAAASR